MRKLFATFAFCGGLAFAGAGFGGGRTAEEIVKDYDCVSRPNFDPAKKADVSYVREFRQALALANARRAALALELLRVQPDHTRLPAMLIERWQDTMMSPATAAATVAEIDEAIRFFTDRDRTKVARQMRAIATIRKSGDAPVQAMPEVDRFLADYPNDPLGASLLGGFAQEVSARELKRRLLKRLIDTFPDGPAAKGARATLSLYDRLGKPFSLDFQDPIKNERVSTTSLKGKVIIVDVWATWCGPCVAEIPKMKALYAKYKTQGVEFIGVSLDRPESEGGLVNVRKFVTKNEVTWPQYYDGKAWEGPLVEKLGIRSIPAVFLIDADGNLASIDARGQLETLIREYLALATKAGRTS
jgi:thiol-disulfide isomerase/thioredoxin